VPGEARRNQHRTGEDIVIAWTVDRRGTPCTLRRAG
jgi:hypothetical protein